MSMLQTDKQQLLKDTNQILSLIKVRTYSLSDLAAVDVKQGSDGIKTLYDRLYETCIDKDVTQNDGIVTLEVNGMILAACILSRKTLPHNGEDYYLVSTICSIDATMLKAYVLREAERYILIRDVFYIKIQMMFIEKTPYSQVSADVDFREKVRFFGDSGYTIAPDATICNPDMFTGGIDLVLDIIEQIHSCLEIPTPFNNSVTIDKRKYASVLHLVRGVRGESGMEKIVLYEDHLKKWNESLEEAGILGMVEETHVAMWKCLKENPELVLPGYMGRGYYHTNSAVRTLQLEMDRFLDIVRINTHAIKDATVNMEDLYKSCRGEMDLDYITSVFEPVDRKFVTTIDVSGVPIAFSILKIHEGEPFVPDLPLHDIYHITKRLKVDTGPIRYLEVELICSSEYSGLGRHLIDFAEAFATRHSIQYITLKSIPTKVGWYRSLGLQPGAVSDIRPSGNDRGKHLRVLFSDVTRKGRVSLRDIHAPSPRFKDPTIEEIVISIIGDEKYNNYRGNHPDQLEEWDQRLEKSKSMDLIDKTLVTMSKRIRGTDI